MKETGFIKQNKEKWIEFEKILQLKKKDPDRLSSLFVQITDDLSYSRTFYPNRSVRVYLNNIAQQVFHSIYKNKRERGKRFMMFWKDELPRLVYESRSELGLSLIVFLISTAIGIISCHNDPDFLRLILGESYVEMTKQNIENGDPMAVYKSMHQMSMFLAITFNNIKVAFIIFLFGILCGVGSIGLLAYNGIMVGVFQYFFIQRGLFWQSFLSIWLHGTLEISSFIIAAAAGITLGKGLVFPGTYSRMESFQLTARRGFKLLMGVVPIITFAAIIESFLTRYTDAPDWVKGMIIFLSLTFMIGYFVWYPIMKARRGFESKPSETKLPPTVDQHIDTDSIKTNGEVFSDTFVFLKKHARPIVLASAALAVGYTLIFALLFSNAFYFSFNFAYSGAGDIFLNAFRYLGDLAKYFSYSNVPLLMLVNVIVFSVLSALAVNLWINMAEKRKLKAMSNVSNFFKSFMVLGFTSLITWVHPVLFFLLLLGVFPVMMLWLFITQAEGTDVFSAIGRTFGIMKGKYFNLLGVNLIFVMVSIIFLFLVSSPVVWIFFNVINWGLDLSTNAYWMLFKVMITFASFTALGVLFTMALSSCALFYYSSKEIGEAATLKRRIMYLREKRGQAVGNGI
jgi:uncharacterized membrane protein SpoIIM required for sporulation